MALFSLLVAIMVERMKLLPSSWQLESLLKFYVDKLFGDKQFGSDMMMALALIFPAVAVQVLMWTITGMVWGLASLLLWVAVAILCFSHLKQRQAFKSYMQAACRGDTQACYHFAEQLDGDTDTNALNADELGAKVGQSVAWINYRFYGAVALFLIFFGPAGAVLYCTVRYFSDESKEQARARPLVDTILTLLDWVPSRLFALGYVFSGQFTSAFACYSKYAFSYVSARELVTRVALAAEPVSEGRNAEWLTELASSGSANTSADPVCMQATLVLLQLSKRNFILLLTCLSLLTIFGVVA